EFFKAVETIDYLIDGSDAYKNYLRASIFNETVNANIGDDKLIEFIALAIRSKANVGISQVGPSGQEDGFVDRWLLKHGFTENDLLNNFEVNILAKDAYVIERQIGEIESNYAYVKNTFGLDCALDPRNCTELWTNKEALIQVTQ